MAIEQIKQELSAEKGKEKLINTNIKEMSNDMGSMQESISQLRTTTTKDYSAEIGKLNFKRDAALKNYVKVSSELDNLGT